MKSTTNKAQSLIALLELFPTYVPPFVVIRTIDLLSEEQQTIFRSLPKETKARFIEQLDLTGILSKILTSLSKVGIDKENALAVRPSVSGEDGALFSFAGMFESTLFVKNDQEKLSAAIKTAWGSIFSERVTRYTASHDLLDLPEHCELIIQKMATVTYSGVLFYYPSDPQRSSIALSEGTGGIVKGESAETLSLEQFFQHLPLLKESLEAVLQRFDQTYPEKALDVEFGCTEKELYLLQLRPITTHIAHNLEHHIFDKSNIGENYPGITLPLTYSFIRSAYGNVYPAFLDILGIKTTSQDQKKIFDNMLGYIHGQIYYNLGNWYRLVAFLPWQPHMHYFFTNMLRPVQALPPKPRKESTFLANLIPAYRLIRALLNEKKYIVKPFDTQYELLFAEYKESEKATKITAQQLLDLFQAMHTKFTRVWGYTIINDVRVMIYFGIYTKLLSKWSTNPNEMLQKLITSQEPASISLLHSLTKVAVAVKEDSKLSELLQANKLTQAQSYIQENPTKNSSAKVMAYVKTYGVRFANELKLETIPINADLSMFLSLLREYIRMDQVKETQTENNIMLQLQNQSFAYLKKWVLQLLQQQTTNAIALRERFRLDRARVFDMARHIFLKIGKDLHERRLLETPRDIFWLTTDEVNGFVNFHLINTSFLEIIGERKKLFAEYEKKPHTRRIDTYGIVQDELMTMYTPNADSKSLHGEGTSQHIVENIEVIVMNELDVTKEVSGKILVVPQTDPGWTILFPLIKGIITEEGNTLSHASIIARELKIPCIVKVKDVTILLKDGDHVTLNGITGDITKL